MARRLRVYGWIWHMAGKQVRCVVAATSMKAVARIVGVNDPRQVFNLGETGNVQEHEVAMREPGVAMFSDLDAPREGREWTRWGGSAHGE